MLFKLIKLFPRFPRTFVRQLCFSQDEEWIRYTFHRDEKEGLFNQLLEFGPSVILESPADQQQEFKGRISALMEAYGS